MKKQNQAGFSVIEVIIVLIVLGLIAGVGYKVLGSRNKSKTTKDSGSTAQQSSTDTTAVESTDPNQPPLKLKSIGLKLDTYNAGTGMAGDIKFTKGKLVTDLIFSDFGYVVPKAISATGQDKPNPQPSFLAPLGTKVMSLVDGIVVNVPKLYSGDYSIQVGISSDSNWLYETEHVLNPLVKVGDKVKAGQVIAEVSNHDAQNNDGLGVVEIGILKGGNPPTHLCPFNYLDASIKSDVQAKLKSFYKAWEDYKGNAALYDESKHVVPGCYTLDPIEG